MAKKIPRISFCGIDGSGKSTLSKELAIASSRGGKRILVMDHGPRIYTETERGTYVGEEKGGALNKITSIANLFGNKYSMGVSFLTYALRSNYLEESAVKNNDPDVVIRSRDHLVDMAAFAAAYSGLFSKDEKKGFALIQNKTGISKSDLLFYLKLPSQTAMDRVKERDHLEVDERDGQRVLKHMDRMQEGYEIVLPVYEDLGVRVVDLEARDTLHNLTRSSLIHLNLLSPEFAYQPIY